jgi:hypothetical protein
MDNGDVVEITTDGHTAILNGILLNTEEKDVLFQSIKRGELKVAHKADPTKPVPVFPSLPAKQKEENPVKSEISPGMMEAIKDRQSSLAKMRSMSSKSYDYEIENGDYSGAEDPEYCKKLLYALRYGDSNE